MNDDLNIAAFKATEQIETQLSFNANVNQADSILNDDSIDVARNVPIETPMKSGVSLKAITINDSEDNNNNSNDSSCINETNIMDAVTITEESLKAIDEMKDKIALNLFKSEEQIDLLSTEVGTNSVKYQLTEKTKISKDDSNRLNLLYSYVISKWFIKELELSEELFSTLLCALSRNAVHCTFLIQALNQLRNNFAHTIKSAGVFSQLTMSLAAVFSKASESLKETSSTETDLSIKTLNNALTMTMTYKNESTGYIISQPIFSYHPLLTDDRFWQLLFYDLVDTQYNLVAPAELMASQTEDDLLQLEQIRGAQLMYIIHTMSRVFKNDNVVTKITKKLLLCQAFSKETKKLLYSQTSDLFGKKWADDVFSFDSFNSATEQVKIGKKEKRTKDLTKKNIMDTKHGKKNNINGNSTKRENEIKYSNEETSEDIGNFYLSNSAVNSGDESLEEKLKLISLMTGYNAKQKKSGREGESTLFI